MADVADIANEIEQERITRILSNHQQNNKKLSASNCEDCGLPIPEARRIVLLGVQTCIHCQKITEQRFRFNH